MIWCVFCVNNTKQYQTIPNKTKQTIPNKTKQTIPNKTKQNKQYQTKQNKKRVPATWINWQPIITLKMNCIYYQQQFHLQMDSFWWVIKPLYGFISDSFPIGGKWRTPYFFLFGLVGFGAWMSLATLSKDVFCLSLFVLSFHGNSFFECLSRFAVFLYLYHINKYIHII